MKRATTAARRNEPLILVVDGDNYERTRIQRILEAIGYCTIGAPSGLHAQQILNGKKAADTPIGMVITEQRMSAGIDGLGLLMLIKSRWPKIRRAIMTTRPPGALVMEARIHADARTLIKPVPAEKLISVVQEELRAYAG